MSSNLPAVRRPRYVQNLKEGDKVKFVGAGPNCTEGVVSSLSGGYVYIVWTTPEGEHHEIERYREEITQRLSEFNPVPITEHRLKYLLEQAEPETEERQRRRVNAQEDLMDLLNQGQIFRNSRGVWCIDPSWGLEKMR